jgi:hypothetical protein
VSFPFLELYRCKGRSYCCKGRSYTAVRGGVTVVRGGVPAIRGGVHYAIFLLTYKEPRNKHKKNTKI